MTGTTVHIPTLETERLILRAPQLSDAEQFIAFVQSDRARFVGGPTDRKTAVRSFGNVSGHWVLRGYGMFIAVRKDDLKTPLGGFGIFHPVTFAEPEFGWSLYSADFEGQGYAEEAMRTVIPWAWPVMGTDTAQSHIDEGNDASVSVAKRLGATFDAEATNIANAPGGEMHSDDGPHVNIWRHHKGAMT